MTLTEIADTDDRVLVRLDRSEGDPLFQLYRFESGRVVTIDDFADPAKARKAAGLKA